MTAVTTSHIVLDDNGRAFVEGTRTRVTMIVMDKINGLTPEQIHAAYPYLTISRIYAALAYYHDHQTELDAEIKQELQEIAALRADSPQPSRAELQARLDDRGKRP